MALRMSTPQKHPKTGVYWFRKAVPMALRALVGKLEITHTLNTKDPQEAKLRHLPIAVAVEEEFARLRYILAHPEEAPKPLSAWPANSIAGSSPSTTTIPATPRSGRTRRPPTIASSILPAVSAAASGSTGPRSSSSCRSAASR
jgi:hypothetical protein